MRRSLAPVIAVAAAMLAPPAGASAQAGSPDPPSTAPAPALQVELTGLDGGRVIAGREWGVRGTVKPFAAGQRAIVRLWRGGRRIALKEVAIADAGDGSGSFSVRMVAGTPGRITVRAGHRATPELGSGVSNTTHVTVLALRAGPGARGPVVRLLQSRLAPLGYVVGRRGVYDARTARAVVAFRKLTNMSRTSYASEEVFRRLARGWGRFKVRHPSHGRHVEADLTHQVIALIERGRAVRIYPMSSGKPSTPTILGSFRVYMKTPGTNSLGMIYSSYFVRGYAIHGYVDVPVYPASHGCLRIPPAEAVSVYDWVRVGTPVDTYYR